MFSFNVILQPAGEEECRSTFSICSDSLKEITDNEICLVVDGEQLNMYQDNFGDCPKVTKHLTNCSNRAILRCLKNFVKVYKHCLKNSIKIQENIICTYSHKIQNVNHLMFLSVINAWLIKNYKERLKYVYTSSCEIIQQINNNFNFCDIKEGRCINRRQNVSPKKYNPTSCCLQNCSHLSENGCCTQNLACKFYFCKYLIQNGIYLSPFIFLPTKIYFTYFQKKLAKYDLFISSDEAIKRLYLAKFFGPFIC